MKMNCPECNKEMFKNNVPSIETKNVVNISREEPERILCFIDYQYFCSFCGISLRKRKTVNYFPKL